MTAQSSNDPLIPLFLLSAALGKGEQAVALDLKKGCVPLEDTRRPLRPRSPAARGWRLSTLRAWRPEVADRCAAILAALDSIPLKAA